VTSIEAPSDESDRFAAATAVADAALPEPCGGERGVLVPPEAEAANPTERSSARTECLVVPGALDEPLRLTVRVRCSRLRRRSVEALGASAGTDALEQLDSLDQPLIPWDEAVAQVVEVPPLALAPATTSSRVVPFRFSPSDEPEIVRSPQGEALAKVVRRRESVDGRVVVRAAPVVAAGVPGGLLKVTVDVENLTGWSAVDAASAPRQAMLRRSLLGVHTLLALDGGRFVSQLSPPEALADAAAGCSNDGTFPVLVDADDAVVLSAPVALDDHSEPAALRLFPPKVPPPVAPPVTGRAGPGVGPGDRTGVRGSGQAPGGDDESVLPVQAMADIPWMCRPDAPAAAPVAAAPAAPAERRVLVAGIGRRHLGDDGFGPVVAQRLAGRELPPGVQAVDYGIRGVQLAHDVSAGYDALILVDAMALGEPPGTLAVVEPGDVASTAATTPGGHLVLDAHTMSPGVVLALLDTFEARVQRVVIIGCQPATLQGAGLSAPVAEAVDIAVDLLEDVLTDVCTPTDAHAG